MDSSLTFSEALRSVLKVLHVANNTIYQDLTENSVGPHVCGQLLLEIYKQIDSLRHTRGDISGLSASRLSSDSETHSNVPNAVENVSVVGNQEDEKQLDSNFFNAAKDLLKEIAEVKTDKQQLTNDREADTVLIAQLRQVAEDVHTENYHLSTEVDRLTDELGRQRQLSEQVERESKKQFHIKILSLVENTVDHRTLELSETCRELLAQNELAAKKCVDYDRLQTELKHLKEENDRWPLFVEKLQRENEILLHRCCQSDVADSDMVQQHAEVRSTSAATSTADDDIDVVDDGRLQNQLACLTEELRLKELELGTSETSLQLLKLELSDERHRHKQLADSIDAKLEAKEAESTDVLAELKQTVGELTETLNTATMSLAEMEKERNTLKSHCGTLTDNLKESKQALDKESARQLHWCSEAGRIAKEVNTLKQTINSYTTSLAQKNAEYELLKGRTAEYVAQNERYRQHHKWYGDVHSRSVRYGNQLQQVRQHLKTAKAELEALRSYVEQLTADTTWSNLADICRRLQQQTFVASESQAVQVDLVKSEPPHSVIETVTLD